MAKRKRKRNSIDLVALSLGPTAARVKRQVSSREWRRIVRNAHKQGFSVEGFLSGQPRALRERTSRSIRKQALQTIGSVYKAAESELGARERTVRAIDEKRRADNEHFLNWLNTESAKQKSDAAAADQALFDRQRQIQADTEAATLAAQNVAKQNAAASTGNVSDPNEFAGFKELEGAQQKTRGLLEGVRTRTAQQIDTNAKHAATIAANNFALHSAAEARRAADTWKAMMDLSDEKEKLSFAKAADAAKEVARLLDQEISKAQSNREFAAALQKLDLDTAQLQETARKNRAADRRASERNKLTALGLQQQVAYQNARLGQEAARLELDWYKALNPKPGSGGGGSKRSMSATNQDAFNAAYADMVTGTYTKAERQRDQYSGKVEVIEKTVRYGPKYVRKNRNLVINQLVAAGYNRKIAQAAVEAFISQGGVNQHPGSFRKWVRKGRHQNKAPAIPRNKR